MIVTSTKAIADERVIIVLAGGAAGSKGVTTGAGLLKRMVSTVTLGDIGVPVAFIPLVAVKAEIMVVDVDVTGSNKPDTLAKNDVSFKAAVVYVGTTWSIEAEINRASCVTAGAELVTVDEAAASASIDAIYAMRLVVS